MSDALVRGTVDAADLGEPFLCVERSRGSRTLLVNSQAFAARTTHGLWVAAGSFASRAPATVAGFQNGMRRAIALAAEHPEAARELLPRYTRATPELADKVAMPRFTPRIDASNAAVCLAAMVELGLVRPDLDVSLLLSACAAA